MKISHSMTLSMVAMAALLAFPTQAIGQQEEKAVAIQTVAKKDPVATWVELLVKKMPESNKVVAASVDRALVAVGKPAIAHLEKIAGGDNADMGKRAKGLIEQINNPRRGRGGQAGRRGGRDRDPFAEMDLTPEQKKQTDALTAKHRTAQQELWEAARSGEMDRSEMREAFQEMREKQKEAYKKVLTPEQFKKYEENTQRRRGGRGGRGGGRRGGDG